MFKVEALSKSYQVGVKEVDVLRNLSLHIDRGQFVSILGPSGCGKTTLLNILAGIEHFTMGSIRYEGEELCLFTDDQWTQWRKRHIGFIFQTFNLIDFMTAKENVELAIRLNGAGRELRSKRAKELLTLVGLEDKADYLPNQLSGGQKQKVAIARALANNPDVLLADEPTGSVDSIASEEIMKMLRVINKERRVTIIMATHNHKLAALADHQVTMADGHIVNDVLVGHSQEKKPKGTAAFVLQQMLGTSVKGKMSFLSAVSLAIKNISTKKKRTILTSMGAAVGVMGVLLTFGIGFSAKTQIMQEVEPVVSYQTIDTSTAQSESIDPVLGTTSYCFNNSMSHSRQNLYITSGVIFQEKSVVQFTENEQSDKVSLEEQTAVEYFDRLQPMLSVTMLLLTGISFIVSGIMITLVTHMGIVERTKEIGIMKAIGFSSTDILQVFTTEGGLLGLLAGVFGVVYASIFGMGINIVTRIVFPMIHTSLYHVNGFQIILCIIFSIGIATFCAYFPARRASKLNPAVSLGYVQ